MLLIAQNFYAVAMFAIFTDTCSSSGTRLRQTIVEDDSSPSKPWNSRPRTAQLLQCDSYRQMARLCVGDSGQDDLTVLILSRAGSVPGVTYCLMSYLPPSTSKLLLGIDDLTHSVSMCAE